MEAAFTRYRPTRTADGEGGFTEILGTGVTLWGIVEVHKSETSIIVDAYEDVEINDVLTLESIGS